MNVVLATKPKQPTRQDWEAVRLLITKLWHQQGKSLASIIQALQHDHGLEVSNKTLKTKLQAWGLVKKMNSQDAEDLLAAQARLEDAGKEGILLLRGSVQSIERVRKYKRRRDRARSARATEQSTQETSKSKVLALSLHSVMRLEPALAVLAKFEAVLRELQYLLSAAKDNGLCNPGETTVNWYASSERSESLERSIQYSTWEGARAFEEHNLPWAGLCWKSAMLALEDLIWEPDLNIWITFIRCCVRLVRFQAKEVGQQFLDKLRWLREELPLTAPHRTFVYALSEVTLGDLADGCLFILEANLRSVELLWPLDTSCRIEYRLLLAEEQFYHGLETVEYVPELIVLEAPAERYACREIWLERSQISSCMLLSNYGRAETIARNSISQLEQRSGQVEMQHADMLRVQLADWYFLLGTIQYYARDVQSQISYFKSLRLHDEVRKTCEKFALEPAQVHRMLTLLDWLNSTFEPDKDMMEVDLDDYKSRLETKLSQDLHDRENAPFRRRLKENTENSVARARKKSRPKQRTISGRKRVVQRNLPLTIDSDKCKRLVSNHSSSMDETWFAHGIPLPILKLPKRPGPRCNTSPKSPSPGTTRWR